MTLRLKGRGDSGRWRCYILVKRYADGGGLTAAGRAKREAVRFEAAEMFEHGLRPPDVARRLRVTRKSAYAWHATWRDGGKPALSSKGPGGFPCQLSDEQAETAADRAGCRSCDARLERGPAVDPRARGRADPQAVRVPVHATWGVVSAAPAGLVAAGSRTPGG
ncbi:helix-turn-helix domain-containing protein [Streptomyces sp. DSM 42041]|uniref:Helix-turn-helix domain-containing protein n=1 Tax=Streptomyces hazeniae TaxID=3075538 RepID=A0ABU2NUM4_9ACTN|nr:helix-turn-helix domain-containing protein [Streptomyces sp. DSM 42041]MDT0380682.1 helix-turn-helix domain-containing protein [Streptomyces sp. DSM 42041]